jgi:hypothetical protein
MQKIKHNCVFYFESYTIPNISKKRRIFMLKNLCFLVCVLVFSTAIFGQKMTKDASPCDAIKGKSYIAWSSGKFDDNPDAASSSKLVFDRSGKGTSRGFLSYKPTDTSGTHQTFNVTCGFLQDTATSPKKYYLHFTISGGLGAVGGDAGNAFITSYDNGSKIWAESAMPGRPMKGWMLQLPPNPPVSDNLVK